jgi:hypothetical protein
MGMKTYDDKKEGKRFVIIPEPKPSGKYKGHDDHNTEREQARRIRQGKAG